MRKRFILLVSVVTVLMSVASWTQILGKGHSEADAVRKALEQADLKDVTVSDDEARIPSHWVERYTLTRRKQGLVKLPNPRPETGRLLTKSACGP